MLESLWVFENSEWKIKGTALCMDARQEGKGDGTQLIFFDCGGRANQKWTNLQ